MTRAVGEAGAGLQPHEESIFSARLVTMMDDILAGASPNAGRFCGYCYHPLPAGRQARPGGGQTREPDLCLHCGRSPNDWPAVPHIPEQVVRMHRDRRSREGTAVRSVAWSGLTLGVVLAIVPLILASAQWWTVLTFFVVIGFFYLLSANLANTLGDAIGYRWGQSLLRRRWQAFTAGRDKRIIF